MSSAVKKSSTSNGTLHDSKPRYVKKLSFGQWTETNLKNQSRPEIVVGTSEDNLFILDKESFVSEWLSKHKDHFSEENNLVYPTSPVLGSSFKSHTKRIPQSPILSSSTKRPRRGSLPRENPNRSNSLNQLGVVRLKRKNDSLSSSIFSSQTPQSGSRVQGKSQEENSRQASPLPESPSTSYVNESPVLSGKMRLAKFRRKRLFEENNGGGKKLCDSIAGVSKIEALLDRKPKPSVDGDETFFGEEKIEEEVEGSEKSSISCVQNSPILTQKVRSRKLQGKRFFECDKKTIEENGRIEEEVEEESGKSSTSCVQNSPVLTQKVRSRKLREKLSESNNKTVPIELKECSNLQSSVKTEKVSKLEVDLITCDSSIVSAPNEKSNSSVIEDETFFEEEEFAGEIEEIEDSGEEDLFESQRIDTCEETQFDVDKSRKTMLPIFDGDIKNKSSFENSLLEETKSNKEVKDERTLIDEDTDSEKAESDFIDDDDTLDVVSVNNVKNVQVLDKETVPVPGKSALKDPDETFFSGASGSCQSLNMQPSQKISQISSSKIKSDSYSQINNEINACTPTQKSFVEPFVNILRTEKKKRKVKKGSLLAKLQTFVSREISYLRMWQHQISQPTFQDVNVQFVDLCIQRSYISYNRQFTECRLIVDTFNLLKSFLNAEAEQNENSNRGITVVTIPEVVGWLKAERGKRLKIYPPWEILDQKNPTLSAMYFIVDEKVNFETHDETSFQDVKRSKRRFDCPCIEERNIVENCRFKMDKNKPNVIREMFIHS